MKRAMFLCLVSVLFMVSALNAQYSLDSYLKNPPRNYKFTMGLVAAAGLSNFTNDDDENSKYEAGQSACGGFFAKLAMNKYIAIQPELVANINKCTQIAKIPYYNYVIEDTIKTSIISIQMPVSLLISPDHLTKGFGFYAGGGPFIGYLVELKSEYSSPNHYYHDYDYSDLTEVSYGIQGMAGIKYSIISADMRASYELSKVFRYGNTHVWNARLGIGIAFSN